MMMFSGDENQPLSKPDKQETSRKQAGVWDITMVFPACRSQVGLPDRSRQGIVF